MPSYRDFYNAALDLPGVYSSVTGPWSAGVERVFCFYNNQYSLYTAANHEVVFNLIMKARKIAGRGLEAMYAFGLLLKSAPNVEIQIGNFVIFGSMDLNRPGSITAAEYVKQAGYLIPHYFDVLPPLHEVIADIRAIALI